MFDWVASLSLKLNIWKFLIEFTLNIFWRWITELQNGDISYSRMWGILWSFTREALQELDRIDWSVSQPVKREESTLKERAAGLAL